MIKKWAQAVKLFKNPLNSGRLLRKRKSLFQNGFFIFVKKRRRVKPRLAH